MALDPELGQLSIAFRGSAGDAADEAPTVFVAQRAVPAVELVPLPTLTPLPTATKAPTPIPTPTLPSSLPTAPELPAGGLTDLPPTLVVGAVLAGIVAIGAIIVLPMLRRRR
jgi:hypothetical protein